jgi:hypothetical protein
MFPKKEASSLDALKHKPRQISVSKPNTTRSGSLACFLPHRDRAQRPSEKRVIKTNKKGENLNKYAN